MDCILGRIDYTIEHSDRHSLYGIANGDQETYESSLSILMSCVGTPHTQTTQLMVDQPLPIDTVLKQTKSNCRADVIFTEVKELASKRKWEFLKVHTTSRGQVWISQEFILTLHSLEKWIRVYLVGGHIFNIIHTIDEEHIFTGTGVDRLVLIGMLTDLYDRDLWHNQHAVLVPCTHIINSDDSHYHNHVKGLEELSRDGHFYFDERGVPYYFVNEVERTLTTSLFLRCIVDQEMRMIAIHLHMLHIHTWHIWTTHI
ncbi:hypothetical protein EV363DRAFT_1396027 [Boletus edulis]|nr:hypothetical protein EV363DRAFT_1396027 [Boletus edulis]